MGLVGGLGLVPGLAVFLYIILYIMLQTKTKG